MTKAQLSQVKLFDYTKGNIAHITFYNSYLFRTWRHSLLDNNDSSMNVLLLHTLAIRFNSFNPNLRLIREEDKHLLWNRKNMKLS